MFRFTIRDLLWLMVIAGLSLGWWLDHREMANRNDHLWSHFIRKASALTHISQTIELSFTGGDTIAEIKSIVDEDEAASRHDPTPLLRDGKRNPDTFRPRSTSIP
jgi:hypothetical protein